MKKIEVFETPKQTFFLSIEDWQVAACEGNRCAAALLDFFKNRHLHYLQKCEEYSIRNKAGSIQIDPWQVQSLNKMNDYTLGLFGRNKLISGVEYLIGRKFLICKSDTQNNKSYILLPEPIQQFINEEWKPFLLTVSAKENPLQVYLRAFARLKINEQIGEVASLELNDPGLESNEQTPFASLESNEGSLISNEYIVTIGNKEDLVTSSNKDTPDGVFAPENLTDFERQIEQQKAQEKFEAAQLEKAQADLKAKQDAEKEKNLRQKKKREYEPKTETVNLMQQMATDFDSAFVFVSGQTNALQFGTVNGEGLQWGIAAGKEFGKLKSLSEILATRLKKNEKEQTPGNIRESWRMFLQMAIQTNEKFILTNFTPSMLHSQFNQIILKIQQLRNGKNFGNFNGASSLMSEQDFATVANDLQRKYSAQGG